MSAVNDGFGRLIDYLRISITDRCNLRCIYCMPPEGVPPIPHDEVLRYEEIERVAQAAAGLGISRLRLTGGEPLVRRDVPELVAMLRAVPGVRELTMTTNGTLLAPLAGDLKAAGLDRVNVSLDTVDPDRYRTITRGGCLQTVLDGIAAAQEAGLNPVKINMVVMHGLNDDETLAMATQSVTRGWHVRYIEMMPLGNGQRIGALMEGDEFDEGGHASGTPFAGLVANNNIRAAIEKHYGPLEPVTLAGNGPAETWRVPGAAGSIGFISAVSHSFCAQCNRLRLSSSGALVPCLFSDREVPLRAALRAGASTEELQGLICQAIALKQAGHHLAEGRVGTDHQMSKIGG